MTLTPEQLAEHNSHLGGSDAYPATGKDPRKSLVDLYREKIGEPPRWAPRPNARMDWGVRLEPIVADWLAEELGRAIVPYPQTRNPDYPYMVAHLDGVLVGGPPREGVEIKTCDKLAAQEFGEVGTDEIPVRYVLQVTHYMIVTNIRRFHVGVLVGGNDARHYVVNFDPELARMLIDAEANFWDCVLTRTIPEPTTLDDADYIWPGSQEKIIRANDDILEAVTALTLARREEARAAREADEIEVSVKAYMGANAILADKRGRKLVTWRSQGRDRFDLKTFTQQHADLAAMYRTSSSYRVFRLA
jgi:putative phage-type endonuclease